MNIRKHVMLAAAATIAVLGISSNASATDSVATSIVQAAPDSLEWISDLMANSDQENYLRYLQIAGAVAPYPISLRGFSPRESRRLAARVGVHPWTGSFSFTSNRDRTRLLPLAAQLRGNSSFPYGSNDGAVWAGRGLTGAATMGMAIDAGSFSLVLAPTAFATQNASFDLLENGHTGALRFADGIYATMVDRPQRFGDDPYGLVSPGNSTLRADIGFFAAGISTANMAWGPLELYPFLIGTNAEGFPHGFIGTSRPVNVWIGSAHGRVIWGRLDQSKYSPVTGSSTYVSPSEVGTRRFATGVLVVFQPRGVTGLELGAGRFFHSPWPATGIPPSYFRKAFEGVLKHGLTGSPEFADPSTSAENQLLSGFARWVFPAVGFEMYAEYGRDDHSWDKRDFSQEPDHSRSYALGFRKILRLTNARMDGLTVELANFQLPHLARTGRGEGSIYAHSVMRQGHTHRGQLLGAPVGVGAAAGSTVRWDSYSPRGRRTLRLSRVVRQQWGGLEPGRAVDQRSSDVEYSLEALRMRRFRLMEATAGITLAHEFNRNFQSDATNASVVFGIRVPFRR